MEKTQLLFLLVSFFLNLYSIKAWSFFLKINRQINWKIGIFFFPSWSGFTNSNQTCKVIPRNLGLNHVPIEVKKILCTVDCLMSRYLKSKFADLNPMLILIFSNLHLYPICYAFIPFNFWILFQAGEHWRELLLWWSLQSNYVWFSLFFLIICNQYKFRF